MALGRRTHGFASEVTDTQRKPADRSPGGEGSKGSEALGEEADSKGSEALGEEADNDGSSLTPPAGVGGYRIQNAAYVSATACPDVFAFSLFQTTLRLLTPDHGDEEDEADEKDEADEADEETKQMKQMKQTMKMKMKMMMMMMMMMMIMMI